MDLAQLLKRKKFRRADDRVSTDDGKSGATISIVLTKVCVDVCEHSLAMTARR